MNEKYAYGNKTLKKRLGYAKIYKNKNIYVPYGGNMKRILSLLLAVMMLFLCLTALAGCTPKDGGPRISVYFGDGVYDFDPTDYYADSNAEALMSLLYEPLFRINARGKLELAGAAKYVVDKEERTITVTLRETYWSDDVVVKAEDYAYAWCNRILDPNNPNPAAALLYDIENAVAVKSGYLSIDEIGVKATEVDQLEITYCEGADVDRLLRNLASVATSPVRQSTVEAASGYWSKSINTMVFNGAFRIRTYDNEANELTIERNKGYHQSPNAKNYTKNVSVDRLVGFFTQLGGEALYTYEDMDDAIFYLADPSLEERKLYSDKAFAYDDTSTYTYVFNTENPLFANSKVRRALSLAIDRNAIIEAITFGKAANGFVPDAFGGSDAALIGASAATSEAEALLAEVDFTGISKSFTLKVNDDAESLAIAAIVEDAWESLSVGFSVTVVPVGYVDTKISDDLTIRDSGIQAIVKNASYGVRDFDVVAVDWQMYANDSFVALAALTSSINGCGAELYGQHSLRDNITGWSDAEYDYHVTAALKAKGTERAEHLKNAEAILCEESPVIPLVFNQNFALVSDELSGIVSDGFGNVVFTKAMQRNYRSYLDD